MKAPQHLQAETRRWYSSVRLETYALEPHHLRLLQLAAEAWERCQQARQAIARDGLVMLTTGKAHPAVVIERDSRLAFARLLRELDLDTEPPPSWRGRRHYSPTAGRAVLDDSHAAKATRSERTL